MILRFLLIIICYSIADEFSYAQNLSNRGKEFWLGYGHNTLFDDGGGTTINGQQLVLYLSTEQAANVTVTVNGTGFTQTYAIPANTVRQTVQIPKTGANDARIRSEGLSNRGINISSDVPIVAYAHQYGANSSGATMLMPVETFGYTYYSLNYHQETNLNPSYSWFFVVASENNTRVEITPSVPTQGGRAANVPFTIDLQRGQIYNVFGQSSGFLGQDLTGSRIRSVAGADGKCHPVGVFSGSSRMVICGSSGDVMQQQIFPSSAWGTKYLTYPTVRTNSIAQTNNNFYRVAVRDPSTVVKRNGVVLTNLIRNFYYEFSGTEGEYIEADKPILVGQYVPSVQTLPGCSYFGVGDPEMFFLSPVEQAINRANFYAASNQQINHVFVSVIIPQGGVSSLRINGGSTFDVQKPHPRNPNYTVVVKRLNSNTQYILQSDSAFSAITYGFGDVESYGYTAGTLVNNLDAIPAIQNTFSQTGNNSFTCPSSPFNFSIRLSYKPTSMTWNLAQVNNLSNRQNVTLNNPQAADSIYEGARMFYEYRLPNEYYFSDTGTYTIPISITSPDIDNCDNTIAVLFTVQVNAPPRADFTIAYNGCIIDTALLTGSPISNGFNITRYRWTYPDGATDSLQQVSKKFDAVGNHPVTLRVIADNGCLGDTTKTVVTHAPPQATFGITPAGACIGQTVTFTDTSSYTGPSISGWYWDFGNGVTTSSATNAPQTQVFNNPGTYTIKHVAQVGSCSSDTAVKMVTIYNEPQVAFTVPAGCLADSMAQFTNLTTVSDGQPIAYLWNFGDPNANAANSNTDTAMHPMHKYTAYGTYNVSLQATTANGCTRTLSLPFTTGGFAPAINFTILNQNALCIKDDVQLRNDMNVVADSIYRIDINWDAVAQPGGFVTINNPQQAQVFTHRYTSFTTPASRVASVKVVVYSKGGCVSEHTRQITLHALPQLVMDAVQPVCENEAPFNLQASVSNGVQGSGVFLGNGVNAAGLFTPLQAGVGSHTVKYVFTTAGGCKDSVETDIVVLPAPVAKFGVAEVCEGDSTLFTDSSTIANGSITGYSWQFGDGTTSAAQAPFYKSYNQFGTYTAQLVVTSSDGCSSQPATKTFRVHAIPQVNFDLPAAVCLPGGEAIFTNRTELPNGNLSELSFEWDLGDGTTTNTTHATHRFSDSNLYTIRLRATSTTGCTSEAVKTFSNFQGKPTASFAVSAAAVCQGTATTFTNLSATSSGSISQYRWQFGDGSTSADTSPSKTYSLPGQYQVRLAVTTHQGCTADTAVTIRVYPQPVVDAGVAVFIPEGTTYQLHPFVNDTTLQFRWVPALQLNSNNILRPVFFAGNSQTYQLTATGAGNCSGSDTVRITVLKQLQIPNVFSPNGDGINDAWLIPGLHDYPGNIVEIYNRYGQQVHRSFGYSQPWNGTFNGNPLPVGTYYYIIDLRQPGAKPVSGSVTIIR